MSRPLFTWLAFGSFLTLVLGALGFVSLTVLQLDSESASARERAALEENIRLALWRMESTITPLIGRENARPAHVYQAFYSARQAYTRMFSKLDQGAVQMPSPLLLERHPFVRLHFHITPGGTLASPQAPAGNLRDLAESGFASHDDIQSATQKLRRLEPLLDHKKIEATLGGSRVDPVLVADNSANQDQQVVSAQAVQLRGSQPIQQALSDNEWQARNNSARQMAQYANPANKLIQAPRLEPQSSLMEALWLGQELVLVRKVPLDGRQVIQGCWLDWPAIREKLIADVADLLPAASLVEDVDDRSDGRAVRRLASLPVRLNPGVLDSSGSHEFSPIQISLVVAWLFALLAACAVGLVLRATLSLSERRAAFVSAVTHELRTPLTTFRLYSEMLADGLVTAEDKRQEYYETLHAEAERLDHLVQNVLSYARLEKNSQSARVVDIAWSEVLGRVADRLEERCRQAEMELQLQTWDQGDSPLVRVDPEAVGRILFNLVDNACKYSAGATDPRIELKYSLVGRNLEVHVRDFGPGVSPLMAQRLFQPFSKTSEEAATSAPGVGLGLALSRRLARKMGGELSFLAPSGPGANFCLRLPLAL